MVDRDALDRIINTNNTNNWWKPELFELHTRAPLPEELIVISPPPAEDKNYNCFIYALGLAENSEIVKDCHGFIYDRFFQKLLDAGELSPVASPRDGDWVLYRDIHNYPSMITHIGIKDGTQVISKWAWGPIVQHEILDVPASYGDDISYAKKISPNKAAALYWKYKEFNIPPVGSLL